MDLLLQHDLFPKLFLISLILVALLLFAFEVVRPDIVAIGFALVLMLTGILTVNEGFAGFSNPAVITVVCMFILSAGLVRTGVADYVANLVLKFGGTNPVLLTIGVMLAVGIMSAFMNNIGAVAVLLPVIFSISQRSGYAASKLLIPLSFGSLMGGLVTLIGTPPNLLVSMALEDAGYEGFKLFDFAPTGLAVLATGILYFAVIGRHWLPVREPDQGESQEQNIDDFLSHVRLPHGSSLIGKPLGEVLESPELGLKITGLTRIGKGGSELALPLDDATVLAANDRLLVEGGYKALLRAKESGLLSIHATDVRPPPGVADANVRTAEVVVAPHSYLVGKSLNELNMPQRNGVLTIALRRRYRTESQDYRSIPLHVGDVLLVQGTPKAIADLYQSSDFVAVQRMEHAARDKSKAPLALAIMAGAILCAATGVLHISVAAMLAVLLMTLTNVIPVSRLYSSVEWRVIFLIACMIPLGTAMDSDHTGTAEWMAGHVVGVAGPYGPLMVMAALYVFTSAITEVMSNAAAAVLVAPIGVAIAQGLGVDPHGFMMAIAIAASTTFMTPIGHQANVLVYGIGNYKFADFPKVGTLLNVLIFLVAMAVVPMVFPF